MTLWTPTTKAGFEADQFRIPYFSTLFSKPASECRQELFYSTFFFFNEWGMRQIPSTNTVLVLTTSCTTLNSGRSRLWLVAGVNRHLPCSRLGARLWRRKKRTSGRCCPHRWRRSNIRSPSPTARSVVRIWKITCESLIKFHWWSEASQLQLGYMCRKLSCSFRFDHLKLKYWCIFLWGSKIIV